MVSESDTTTQTPPPVEENKERAEREAKADASIRYMEETIADRAMRLAFLKKHREFFIETGIMPAQYAIGDTIDFDHLEHADIIKVVQQFGGTWRKEYRAEVVDYTRTLGCGIKLRCYGGKPPPNCKVVEYEEVEPEKIVPARTVKKFKLQCVESVTPASIGAPSTEVPQPVPAGKKKDDIPF